MPEEFPTSFLGIPPLPPPPARSERHAHGLLLARHWAIQSRDPILRSGAVAIRGDRLLAAANDSMPLGVRDSGARRRGKDTRPWFRATAPAALVAAAARGGISLNGSTAYVWPLLEDAPSAALLIAAGCMEIATLDVPIPSRMEGDQIAIQQMCSEAGVLLSEIQAPPSWDTPLVPGTIAATHDSPV
ncbi:MAG: hypothetical protein ACO4B5_11460 [Steroidobacteraceae bacterium]